jgi:hypothetical protein
VAIGLVFALPFGTAMAKRPAAGGPTDAADEPDFERPPMGSALTGSPVDNPARRTSALA